MSSRLSAKEAEARFVELVEWANSRPARDGMDVLRSWRDRVEVARSQIIDELQAAGLTDRQLDRIIGSDTTTRADRNRVKNRAATLGRNAELANEVASGELTVEQLDAICVADAKTDGRAATDRTLLTQIADAPADAARRCADQWVAGQIDNADLEAKRREQRARREARKGQTTDGLASLTISGDDVSVAEMWSTIVDTANDMYIRDGGRDLAAGKHPRTDAQRLFDAAHQHLVAQQLPASPSARSRVTIVATASKLAGTDSTPAEMIGVGPIPDSLLEQFACGADLVGMLFDGAGEVLWHGRGRRYPSRAQMLALIARDKGCVLCGADPSRCQAHHLIPWSAPLKGRTDITNLALLCQQHHRDLHERNHTLYRDRTNGRWRTRPATANETPKPRPPNGPARAKPRGEPDRQSSAPTSPDRRQADVQLFSPD